ncbi:antitoxin component HigA of HigAB toxin-antitoxin module [Leptospira meyeri]|uniref:Antitoxin component HigA of HigAB toxin-antitoxin module n=1 Tax=Leptospira meyeri TaxID=29508 RepID=A0A4R8MUB2_LEPME|nr:hypothetical protein [Leptospira meyeri]EKJ85437.1 hypothetical protein LEP1GSC017_3691 [Leptospira meyeri serovar Hardjo str. Went 5]TDY71317.1 antitoxin component HigA of HigAB toxin-antitoxin module [Leptospira meyeri]
MRTKLNNVVKVRKVNTEEEFETALKEILILMTKKKSIEEKTRYGALLEAVKEYENGKLGIDKVNLPALIHFQMNQKGITQNHLSILLGDAPLTSKLLSGKAEISKKVAIVLNKYLEIDFKILFQDEIEKESKQEVLRLKNSVNFSGRGRKKRELVKH